MALERARRPGRSYARIGAPHGLTRDGTRKAVLRAMADPANREAVEAADRERREFLARFAEGGAAPARRPDPTAAAVDCPECPAGMAAARGGAK